MPARCARRRLLVATPELDVGVVVRRGIGAGAGGGDVHRGGAHLGAGEPAEHREPVGAAHRIGPGCADLTDGGVLSSVDDVVGTDLDDIGTGWSHAETRSGRDAGGDHRKLGGESDLLGAHCDVPLPLGDCGTLIPVTHVPVENMSLFTTDYYAHTMHNNP